jgi:hypothetical protein
MSPPRLYENNDEPRDPNLARGVAVAERRRVARRTRANEVTLPESGASIELFSVDEDDLSDVEQSQPGWCIRVVVPDVLPVESPPEGGWNAVELLAEIIFTTGGIEQRIEVDAYPAFSIHVAAERVVCRLKWSRDIEQAPRTRALAQVTRGLCPTTATRSYAVAGADAVGDVPVYSTRWGLFVTEGDVLGDLDLSLALRTADDPTAGQLLQTVSAEELQGVAGGIAFPRLPPGARRWAWDASNLSYRLVFYYGEAFG